MNSETKHAALQRPAFLALLTALVALGPLSTDLYLPSLPELARDFAIPPEEAQLTLSSFLAGFAAAILFYGPLTDRFGRRPVLLTGLTIYAAVSLAMVIVRDIDWLIGLRFLQAVGSCSGAVICRAMVRDVYGLEGTGRAMSYLSAATALAPAIGPIIGGLMTELAGWRGNFSILCFYGVAVLALAARYLPETNPSPETAKISPIAMLRTYRMLLTHRLYVGHVLSATFGYSGIFCFLSASSFVLIDVMGLEPRWFGFCFVIFVLGYMTGAIVSGKLCRRVSSSRLVGVGALVALSGACLLVIWLLASPSLLALLLPIYIYMVGVGLTLPNAQAGAIGPFPQSAGAASALVGFIQMGVAAIIGAALGQIAALDAMPMAIAILLTAIGLVIAHFIIVRPAMKASIVAASAPRQN